MEFIRKDFIKGSRLNSERMYGHCHLLKALIRLWAPEFIEKLPCIPAWSLFYSLIVFVIGYPHYSLLFMKRAREGGLIVEGSYLWISMSYVWIAHQQMWVDEPDSGDSVRHYDISIHRDLDELVNISVGCHLFTKMTCRTSFWPGWQFTEIAVSVFKELW